MWFMYLNHFWDFKPKNKYPVNFYLSRIVRNYELFLFNFYFQFSIIHSFIQQEFIKHLFSTQLAWLDSYSKNSLVILISTWWPELNTYYISNYQLAYVADFTPGTSHGNFSFFLQQHTTIHSTLFIISRIQMLILRFDGVRNFSMVP